MKTAVYPGSFDPLTNGHVDVALRAAKIFDEIIIRVADNPEKEGRYLFNAEERISLAKAVFKDYPDIKVVCCTGLVVKEAKKLHAQALIRGLRAVTDYEAEYQRHEVNEFIEPDIDRVYLMAHKDQAFVSSSNIKEIFFHGEDISRLVPLPVLEARKKKKEEKK